jgi:hypothetical protein
MEPCTSFLGDGNRLSRLIRDGNHAFFDEPAGTDARHYFRGISFDGSGFTGGDSLVLIRRSGNVEFRDCDFVSTDVAGVNFDVTPMRALITSCAFRNVNSDAASGVEDAAGGSPFFFDNNIVERRVSNNVDFALYRTLSGSGSGLATFTSNKMVDFASSSAGFNLYASEKSSPTGDQIVTDSNILRAATDIGNITGSRLNEFGDFNVQNNAKVKGALIVGEPSNPSTNDGDLTVANDFQAQNLIANNDITAGNNTTVGNNLTVNNDANVSDLVVGAPPSPQLPAGTGGEVVAAQSVKAPLFETYQTGTVQTTDDILLGTTTIKDDNDNDVDLDIRWKIDGEQVRSDSTVGRQGTRARFEIADQTNTIGGGFTRPILTERMIVPRDPATTNYAVVWEGTTENNNQKRADIFAQDVNATGNVNVDGDVNVQGQINALLQSDNSGNTGEDTAPEYGVGSFAIWAEAFADGPRRTGTVLPRASGARQTLVYGSGVPSVLYDNTSLTAEQEGIQTVVEIPGTWQLCGSTSGRVGTGNFGTGQGFTEDSRFYLIVKTSDSQP